MRSAECNQQDRQDFVCGVLIPPALNSGHQASNQVPRQASTREDQAVTVRSQQHQEQGHPQGHAGRQQSLHMTAA